MSAEAAPRTVYLHPGRLFASAEPARVCTVLGSCVAVCLWERRHGIGGINHYALPSGAARGADGLRFGEVAIPALFEEVLGLGARRSDLEAKVFGGACLREWPASEEEGLGARNVEIALAVLRAERVPVTSRSSGGRRGRKLVFHTATGDAWVKEL